MTKHWQTATLGLLCGGQPDPDDRAVDELTPADCPHCLEVMAVARRACEIVFTESCRSWTANEIRDQLIGEFGHALVRRAKNAFGSLIDPMPNEARDA
jgi:hypothetical protein